MPRGKKPHSDPPILWSIHVRTSIANKVTLILSDPLSGKPRHGARSKLINQLLDKWIAEQQKETPA